MLDSVGTHLKAGSERECVYNYIGGACESEFLSLLCVCMHMFTGLDCEYNYYDKCI